MTRSPKTKIQSKANKESNKTNLTYQGLFTCYETNYPIIQLYELCYYDYLYNLSSYMTKKRPE